MKMKATRKIWERKSCSIAVCHVAMFVSTTLSSKEVGCHHTLRSFG